MMSGGKVRLTAHNGRAGKHGVYSATHNDRNFVAKNDDFKELANMMAKAVLELNPKNVEEILEIDKDARRMAIEFTKGR